MAEVVGVSSPPSSVYGWLSTLPLAASAGSTVTNIYEVSKNYNCVTQYTLGTVESSVKLAASAVAPVVKHLDKPIQAVDSYAVSKLMKLEEKVPAVKAQPEEVVSYLTETKDVVAGKLAEGCSTISTRISESRDSLVTQLASGKEAVCSKLRSGADAVTNSPAGIAVSESKQAIASRITQGKEVLGSTLASGCDAISTKIQSGAESIANTRAGCLVGSGIDRTLATTENLVEYLLPEIENEKELYIESESKDEEGIESESKDEEGIESESKDEEGIEVELPHAPQPCVDRLAQDEGKVGRVERICGLSRKVKVRTYYRSIQKLQVMQKSCKSTLEQLKEAIDLLKLAQAARDGMDKQYQAVTSALKDFEEQLKHMMSRPKSVKVDWPSKDEDEEGVKVEWLDPKPQGYIESSLDYAKHLSEKIFHTFQSVTVVTNYLPSRLKNGATQGYQYAQELYSTLKPVHTSTDLTAKSLHRISSLLETQIGYVTQLGTYLASVLQREKNVKPEEPPDEDVSGEDGDNESSDSEIEEPCQ